MDKICPSCNYPFSTNREKAIYCSNRCRMIAYRKRNGIVTKQSPTYSECQNPRCNNKIVAGGRSDKKYCRSACRKAVANSKVKQTEVTIENIIEELMNNV